MTLVADVATNVLAGAVTGALVGGATAVVRSRGAGLSYVLFWKQFSNDLTIIISGVPGAAYDPKMRVGEQPPLTLTGDGISMGRFLELSSRWPDIKPKLLVGPDRAKFDEFKERNLLIIGGPKYNAAADQYLVALDKKIKYQFERYRRNVLGDGLNKEFKRIVGRQKSDEWFRTETKTDGDHGMVIVTRNPFNGKRFVAIAAGLSTLSTQACAIWLRQAGPRYWIRLKRGSGFQVVVKCTNTGTATVANIEVCETFFLTEY